MPSAHLRGRCAIAWPDRAGGGAGTGTRPSDRVKSPLSNDPAMWGEREIKRGGLGGELGGPVMAIVALPCQMTQFLSVVQVGQGSWGTGTRTSASSRAWSSLCCKCACCAWLQAPSLLWPFPGAGLSTCFSDTGVNSVLCLAHMKVQVSGVMAWIAALCCCRQCPCNQLLAGCQRTEQSGCHPQM